MTPDTPQDPQKGKVADEKVPEEAAAAKDAAAQESAGGAQPEPKRKRTRRKAAPQAEGASAAEGGRGEASAGGEAEGRDRERSEAGTAAEAPPAQAEEPAAAAEAAEEAERARRGLGRKAAKPAEAPRRRRERRPPAAPGVTVRAQARYVRTSARKARLVCDHIRGKDVAEARAILAFTPRGAAKAWSKLLESAVANAEHNHELVGDDLRIVAVYADEGPTLKRFRPRAMGRATRIRKRTSHLTITLTPKES